MAAQDLGRPPMDPTVPAAIAVSILFCIVFALIAAAALVDQS